MTGAVYLNMLQEPIVAPFVSCIEMRTCDINKTGHPHITIVMSGPTFTTLFLTNGWNTEDLLITTNDLQI